MLVKQPRTTNMVVKIVHGVGVINLSMGMFLAGLGAVTASQASVTSTYSKNPKGSTDKEKQEHKKEAKNLLVGYALGSSFLLLGALVFIIAGFTAFNWNPMKMYRRGRMGWRGANGGVGATPLF